MVLISEKGQRTTLARKKIKKYFCRIFWNDKQTGKNSITFNKEASGRIQIIFYTDDTHDKTLREDFK